MGITVIPLLMPSRPREAIHDLALSEGKRGEYLHAKGGVEIFVDYRWFSIDKVYTKLTMDWKVCFYY